MAVFSLHEFSFFRHCGRITMLVFYFSIFSIYFDIVNCASLTNSLEKSSSENGVGNATTERNSTFFHRQFLSPEPVFVGNPYLHSPSFGFPFYQNFQQFTQPALQTETSSSTKSASKVPVVQSQRKRVKVKAEHLQEDVVNVSTTEKNGEVAEKNKSKRKKDKTKKEKVQKEENDAEKIESKTVGDEGTERGCPACIAGTCDPFLDTNVNISGIPVIQIIIALAVGAFWAAVFAFILHNFIEYKEELEEGGGYGYGPAPVSEYGAPAPAAQYGTPQSEYGAPAGYNSNNRISSGNKGYGRSSRGYSFNDLSNWVWGAIDKLASKYDDN